MASKKVNIQIDTKADTTGAKQAETAMDALSTANTRAATAATTAATNTGRVGQIATSAGYQVQDFAIQVAGGTSALTAMSQQAPQFLGVFGPGGAIAGALIAVGAIAAKVFMGMRDDSASAAENATLLADAVKQIGENAGKAVNEDIDFGLQKMADAAQEAEDLIDVLNRVTQAQNAASLAAISDAESIRSAESQLSGLLGNKVDAAKEIEAQLAAETAQRQEMARQEIESQNRTLAEAKQREINAEQRKLETQSALIDTENLRQKEAAKLEILRAQRAELEKQAAERGKLSEGEIPFMATPAAERAQAQLEDPAFQALIAATEQKVDNLDKQIAAQGGKLAEAVKIAGDALEKASTEVAVIEEVVAKEIPRIEQTLQAEGVKAQVEGLAEISKAAAEEISTIAESAKPETTGQAAALETLKLATADGKITADETVKVANALQQLNGVIGTNMQTSAANVQALIQTVNKMQKTLLDQKRQIDALNNTAGRSSGS